jgi:hypothetical protein
VRSGSRRAGRGRSVRCRRGEPGRGQRHVPGQSEDGRVTGIGGAAPRPTTAVRASAAGFAGRPGSTGSGRRVPSRKTCGAGWAAARTPSHAPSTVRVAWRPVRHRGRRDGGRPPDPRSPPRPRHCPPSRTPPACSWRGLWLGLICQLHCCGRRLSLSTPPAVPGGGVGGKPSRHLPASTGQHPCTTGHMTLVPARDPLEPHEKRRG